MVSFTFQPPYATEKGSSLSVVQKAVWASQQVWTFSKDIKMAFLF
jgi:hypothetical protein